MSMLVAALVFVPLLAVAIACFVWSLGATWPIRDEALLARTVIGRPGIERMPPRVFSLLAALLALGGGIVALSLADHESGGLWLTLLGALCGVLLVARGLLGFSPRWRARHSQEPFAGIDRRFYSPMALALGAGVLVLCLMRLF
jgi:hypothetical protein